MSYPDPMGTTYAERLARLPLPTAEQTARFASHVADNHSWYKHLPFFPPGAIFVVFPNPQAGRSVKFEDGRYVVRDVEHGDYFEHHSRLATKDYLDRFGHWDYFVVENPRVTDCVDGPWIYGEEEEPPELLPERLKGDWSCRLTAFLRPAPPMFAMSTSEFKREAKAFEAYVRRRSTDPSLARYRAVIECVRDDQESAFALWQQNELRSLVDAECQAQKGLLRDKLEQVRRDSLNLQRSGEMA